MNFIFGKALLSLLFYTYNPYFFTTFSKFLSLLFPYFSVDGHLKACSEEVGAGRVFTNTFQTLPDIRSGTVMNFIRPNNILQDRKKK